MQSLIDARLKADVAERMRPVREKASQLVGKGQSAEAVELLFSLLEKSYQETRGLELERVLERLLRRSEKLDPRQLKLLAEELAADDGDACSDEELLHDPVADNLAKDVERLRNKQREKRKRPGRNKLPADLPREIIELEVSEAERTCPCCGKERVQIGVDVREELEVVPAQFKVKEYRKAKLACSRCKDGVVCAAGPEESFDRILAGPTLLSHLTVCKYADHLPLRRMQKVYGRLGVPIAASTLVGWIAMVASELEPLYERLWEQVKASYLLQTDATGLRVLDRDHPDGVRLGSMWCYVGDRRLVVFRYAPTGKGIDGPWTFLADREGYIQADAAGVFDRLYNGKVARAAEVGCWAHTRRKFHKLLESDQRVAVPLKLIGNMYLAESYADEAELSIEQRLDIRREKTTGFAKRLKKWLGKTASREPPASALAKACAYPLNHWTALTRFLEDARLPLDNNFCELQIRDVAVGRKNYLFAGSDAGGHRAATLYSLLRTCALHQVDPVDWLEDVLRKLAAGWPHAQLAALLPQNWTPTRRQD